MFIFQHKNNITNYNYTPNLVLQFSFGVFCYVFCSDILFIRKKDRNKFPNSRFPCTLRNMIFSLWCPPAARRTSVSMLYEKNARQEIDHDLRESGGIERERERERWVNERYTKILTDTIKSCASYLYSSK